MTPSVIAQLKASSVDRQCEVTEQPSGNSIKVQHPMKALSRYLLLASIAGCASNRPLPPPTTASRDTPRRTAPTPARQGTPYNSGPFPVRQIRLDRGEIDAPLPMLILTPTQAGRYPVVVFQHGFVTRNSSYTTLLRHLASHGFIVVAPQMYEPGITAFLGNPTAAQEAESATRVLDWLPGHLGDVTGVAADVKRLGLAGHSRGGKVVWIVLTQDPTRARAVAGVDPVDGMGGPWGNQPRVITGPLAFRIPSLVIGAGRGGACAPAGDNHVQFYAASPSPSWHVVAPNQGHADMLDEDANESWLARLACPTGPDREGMRRLTAGLLVACFRGGLQEDSASLAWLTEAFKAPVPIDVCSK